MTGGVDASTQCQKKILRLTFERKTNITSSYMCLFLNVFNWPCKVWFGGSCYNYLSTRLRDTIIVLTFVLVYNIIYNIFSSVPSPHC